MIKIIRHGTRQIKECDHCGCLFSYDEVDTFIELKDKEKDKNLDFKATRFIECPQCKEKLVLEAMK